MQTVRTKIPTPLASAAMGCGAHELKDHSPVLFDYLELHHVIPQAWQHFWIPDGVTLDPSTGLWDSRTVPLCRTGHGNVHFKLVRLMRGEPLAPPRGKRQARAFSAEVAIAQLGMERWITAGGSLDALRGSGHYGEI